MNTTRTSAPAREAIEPDLRHARDSDSDAALPSPHLSVLGIVGLAVGGWPIFKEAFENLAARRMTVELSMPSESIGQRDKVLSTVRQTQSRIRPVANA